MNQSNDRKKDFKKLFLQSSELCHLMCSFNLCAVEPTERRQLVLQRGLH